MIVTGPEVVEWVAARTDEHGNYGSAVGIGWATAGGLVAGVVYNEYNDVNICMHVAAEGRHWMTRQFLWTAFDYPFNQAKVARITGIVAEGDVSTRKFDEHLGFTLETRLKGAHPSGDLLIYVMWRQDCKWLGLKHV